MNNPVLSRVLSIFVAFLLFFYLGYQIYNAKHVPVETEVALLKTEPDTVQTTGIAVRKESVMKENANGVVTYTVENGGKVAKGGKIAVTYASAEDAAAQQKLTELDTEISRLQKLSTPGNTYAANPESLNKQINQELTKLLVSVKTEGTSGAQQSREDFLYTLNEKQIVTNRAASFSSRIKSLQEQRAQITTSHGGQTGTIVSPSSGYFINKTDGWESILDYNTVKSLSVEQIQSLAPAAPAQTVGKIAEDFKWYFACVVPAQEAVNFKEGAGITIEFPFASNSKVPAVVVAVNQKNQDANAAVILESRNLNSSLAVIRKETARLQITDYSGIIVSQRAIHFETVQKNEKDKDGKVQTVKKEVKGVYVMHGDEMEFRQVIPLYSTGSYVICKQNPSAEELMTKETVKLYDEVVVGGTDLYNGKVVR